VSSAVGVEASSQSTSTTAWIPPQGVTNGNPWLADLERESRRLLDAGVPDVWDTLSKQFEARLIQAALDSTRGRRIEAAQKLGIGRNTITRKIQELGLED
jgi:two-component system, NtrC family, nitrogen regulation response regulator GlnG